MPVKMTTEDWLRALGEAIRDSRLARRIDQERLATNAGISARALRSLESGDGSSLSTFVKVVRALGREEWLADLDERPAEPSPLERLRETRRQPARPRRAPRRMEH